MAAFELENTRYLYFDDEVEMCDKFLNFCRNKKVQQEKVPYNILVSGDNPDKNEEYCLLLLDAARKSKLFNKGFLYCSAEEVFAGKIDLSKALSKYAIFVLAHVEAADVENTEWFKLEKFFELANENEVVVILAVFPDAENKIHAKNENLYRRIFANDFHTQLKTVTAELEENYLIKKLEKNDYRCSEDFCREIHDYIRTVYPKADLKEKAFGDDLYNRIIRKCLIREEIPDVIDVDCVPFYIKNEIEETGETQPIIKVQESMPVVVSLKQRFGLQAFDDDGKVYEGDKEKQNIKNILVLALSTFPYDREKEINSMSRSQYTAGTFQCFGYYQLDPVPRYLMKILSDNHEQLDEIIMLCTDDALAPVKSVLLKSKDTHNNIQLENISARDYFIASLRNEYGRDLLFTTIEIKEEEQEKAIADVVSHLRDRKDTRIFLDTHGGFRGFQLTTEAILSLLKIENIVINTEDVFSVKYAKESKIIADSAPFKIFDFVSGMDAFINYGRADMLEQFLQSIDPENKDELLLCIREIAEGIQLCLLPKFETGISHLALYFRSIKKSGNVYLNLFEERIKKDYGNLIYENYTVIDEVNWCLQKGFYQQTLTLIESKMPKYLKEKGILRYDDNCIMVLEEEKNNDKRSENTEINCYFINSYATRICQKDYITEDFERSLNGILNNSLYSENYLSYYAFRRRKPEVRPKVGSWVTIDFSTDAVKSYVVAHTILKMLRNCANHADERNDSLQKVNESLLRQAIEKYLEILDKLVSQRQKMKFELARSNENRDNNNNTRNNTR